MTEALPSTFPTTASAGKASIAFDIGGVIGGILAGHLKDRYSRVLSPSLTEHHPLIIDSDAALPPVATASSLLPAANSSGRGGGLISFIFLILTIPALIVYAFIGNQIIPNICVLIIIGALLSGPYSLITSSVSVELGQHESLRGNQRAVAMISGILDASGSAGSVLQAMLVPAFGKWFGWRSVFWLLTACTAVSAICLIKLGYRELADLWSAKMKSRRVIATDQL